MPFAGVDRLALDRAEQVQHALERRLHAGDGVEHVLLVDPDELPGAAVLDVADVDVVAEQEQERLIADEFLRLVDGVAEAFGVCCSAKCRRSPKRRVFPIPRIAQSLPRKLLTMSSSSRRKYSR